MAARAQLAADPVAEMIAFVRRELAARADSGKAIAMAAYMKTTMPFYGVPKPAREVIVRELRTRFPLANRAAYQRAVVGLWRLPHREEKYFAIEVARSRRDFIVPASMPLYRRMIAEGGWWDLVDEIAAHLVGPVLLNHRAEIAPRSLPPRTLPPLRRLARASRRRS